MLPFPLFEIVLGVLLLPNTTALLIENADPLLREQKIQKVATEKNPSSSGPSPSLSSSSPRRNDLETPSLSRSTSPLSTGPATTVSMLPESPAAAAVTAAAAADPPTAATTITTSSPTTTTAAASAPASAVTNATPTATIVKKKKPWYIRLKNELVHYGHGSVLLWYEVKLSFRYLRQVLRGNTLTRREYRQLRRTVSDLLRLVPFLVLVAIPFAELALPILLKVFPNMLPSTFEKQFEKEEKRKKLLRMRLQLAKFLQETVGEMATHQDGKGATAAKEFTDFFRKIRTTGEPAETQEIIKVAQKFEDELTMENVSRPQLVSMCKYMGMSAFGTDSYLRFQLRSRMRQLHADDQMIYFEGVKSLSPSELQRACIERGIKTTGVPLDRLAHDLQQWLDLHLIHKVPSSLLILSRAFILTDQPMTMPSSSTSPPEVTAEAAASSAAAPSTAAEAVTTAPVGSPTTTVTPSGAAALPLPTAEALQATLQSLPKSLITEAELKLSDLGKPMYKKRLEALRQEEELIAEERAQEKEATALAAVQQKKDDKGGSPSVEETSPVRSAASSGAAPAPQVPSEAISSTQTPSPPPSEPAAPSSLPPTSSAVTVPPPAVLVPSTGVGAPDLADPSKELSEAIKVLVSRSAVDEERVQLEWLKSDRAADLKRQEKESAEEKEGASIGAVEKGTKDLEKTPDTKAASASSSAPSASAPAPAAPPAPGATPKETEAVAAAALAKTGPLRLGEAEAILTSPSLTDAAARKAVEQEARKQAEEDEDEDEVDAQEVEEARRSQRKALAQVDSHVDKLLAKLSAEVEQYDAEVGSRLNLIKPDAQGQIRVQDLRDALKVVRLRPDQTDQIHAILTRLDQDQDGLIALTELLEVIRNAEAKQEDE